MIAIYTRQSLEKKDSISLESQLNLCKTLIGVEEYKVYSDSGYSGKNIDRPQMKTLLDDIERGLINKVIVYKLDRISRSILDFNNLLEFFKKYEVEFVSYSENLDTHSPIGRAMINIIATFAQLEREQIAERVKVNYYARGGQGRFLGGIIPYGFNKIYININGKKAPILEANDKRDIIIDIFNKYAYTNMSLGDIQRYLNEKGIKSASGKTWDNSKISRILRNVIYCKADASIYEYYKEKGVNITNDIEDFSGINGCFLYGKREANERRYTNIKNHYLSVALHEGMIDSRTFLKCQYKLDSNKQIKNSGKSKISYISGLLKCGHCGYTVSINKNSVDKRYLVCRGKHIQACNGFESPILADEIESIVDREISKKLKELSDTKLEKQKIDTETNELKIQITKIDEEIESLLNKISEANDTVMKYINDRITKLDEEKSIINKKLQHKKVDNTFDDLKELFINTDFESLNLEKKKEVAGLLIDKIIVKNEEVVIRYKI